jgi:hypothetical protein
MEDTSFELIQRVGGRRICRQCGQDLKQAIVPPIAQKASWMYPSIKAQWTIARELLEEAEEWIFIGYSLPTLDIEARALFKSACRDYPSLLSRGFKYRLRLVVELIPKRSVLDVQDSQAATEPKVDYRKLRGSLNNCLTRRPNKGLLERAIQAHGPEKKPTEALTKAFSKSLHECLDGHVPETFNLSVDLFCDRKATGWH